MSHKKLKDATHAKWIGGCSITFKKISLSDPYSVAAKIPC